MSTYWGYACLDCQESSEEHWLNHGEEDLLEFYEFHQLTLTAHKQFTKIVYSLETAEWAASEMRIFLDEHAYHNVVLENEYGEYKTLEEVKSEK